MEMNLMDQYSSREANTKILHVDSFKCEEKS